MFRTLKIIHCLSITFSLVCMSSAAIAQAEDDESGGVESENANAEQGDASPEPERGDGAEQDDASPEPESGGGAEQSVAAEPDCAVKPWYDTVTEDARQQARELFAAGTQLLERDGDFAGAIGKLNEALANWDNPSIHYNLMLAHKGLGHFRDAYNHAQEAARYGPCGLPPGRHKQVVAALNDLASRFAEVRIVCNEPGTHVDLDGNSLLVGPGTETKLLDSGRHSLVAEKKGYLLNHQALNIFPAQGFTVSCRMARQEDATVTKRRWPRWQRWGLAGASVGVGMVALGGFMQWRAVVNNQSYHDVFAEECPSTGCFQSDYSVRLKSLETRSTWYRRISYGAYVTGGAVVAAGTVFLYINRNRQLPNENIHELNKWQVTPTAAPDAVGVTATRPF